ncbi:hypothetical protein NsoK4_02515 [Nitrosopumilus sp. K4]|uniref:hypothetical protein n=1 Tax=Nitrosopumilus sp. K4 TaxID=2795383 RepID=UPI001BA83C2C|nr:hypothetical protein [Nitrosopumilus sp. K4]QUC65158.1 hypothetical protein NsoK4_02515 [Nitrosopumilus sp. K4]
MNEEELMKSIIVLLQNDKGDKDILIRILNNLKNDRQIFGPDKNYLTGILERFSPEDIRFLSE